LKGLASIPEKNGKIIRPLLPFPATEIENYAKENQIAFRTDNSNFDLQFQRNRIRHNIIPQLEILNPQFINTLTQNIAHFRQSYQFYQNQLQQIINKLITISSTETVVNISSLLKHPDSALLLFEILNSYGFNGVQSTQILESLTGESGKIFYSKTHSVIKNRNSLIIRILNNDKTLDKPIIFNCYADLTSFGFTVSTICYTPDFQLNKSPQLFYADADKVQFPLTLRTWQYGDRFHPFGMKGSKKVSDFFTDAKIDIQKKQSIKLLCQGNDIMWIIGYRTDDRFKITAATKTVLIIEQYNIP
jgi:tRNA(Ile)-lysidine synthase